LLLLSIRLTSLLTFIDPVCARKAPCRRRQSGAGPGKSGLHSTTRRDWASTGSGAMPNAMHVHNQSHQYLFSN
jgi:hypothetical protein